MCERPHPPGTGESHERRCTGGKSVSKSEEEQEASKLAELLQADGLPGVFVSSLRPWRDLTDEALAHLVRSSKAHIFVRQGELVRIRRKEDGTPTIAPMNDAALKHLLAKHMNFVRIGPKGPQHIAPPDDSCRICCADAGSGHFRHSTPWWSSRSFA